MAVFRIFRKLFNTPVSISSIQQTNKQDSPGLLRSNSKPGTVPSSPVKSDPVTQQKEMNSSKMMNQKLQIARLRLQKQDKALQNSALIESSKTKREQSRQIQEAQKIEEQKTNNQNKLQVSLNNNRPDQGKVMPTNLVKSKTVAPDTKSVKG